MHTNARENFLDIVVRQSYTTRGLWKKSFSYREGQAGKRHIQHWVPGRGTGEAPGTFQISPKGSADALVCLSYSSSFAMYCAKSSP
jgi:hypothetical protein